MPFVPGENVGPYRIIEQLGQGGMATVYKAFHPALDRYVAIKALHPAMLEDPGFLARFHREAKIVAKLEHPNIVPIYDYAEHAGRPYLVMKFIEGETLKARLKRGPLAISEALKVVEAVGEALSYAHKRGYLHRDIKPSNVLLTSDGSIYLADFGLARIAEQGASTLSGDMLMGTPHYISPEQARGESKLDEGTDIYSFGVLLYELVVGKVPFDSDTPFSIIHDHIYTPMPLPRSVNASVPESMELVLLKTLSKERGDRFQTIDELVEAFCMVAEGGDLGVLETEVQPSHETFEQPQILEPVATVLEAQVSQPSVEAAISTSAREMQPTRKSRRHWLWIAGGFVLSCLVILFFLSNFNPVQDVSNQPEVEKSEEGFRELITPGEKPEGKDPFDHMKRGEELLQSGDEFAAAQAFVFAGDIFQSQGDQDASGDAYGRAAEIHRTSAEELAANEEWVAAAEEFLRAGELYYQAGVEEAASDSFYRSAEIHLGIAEDFLTEDRSQDAYREFIQAGEIYLAAGDYLQAVEILRVAAEISDRPVATQRVLLDSLAQALFIGSSDPAMWPLLEEMGEQFPDWGAAQVSFARSRLHMDDFDQARGILEEILAQSPEDVMALAVMAELHIFSGEVDKGQALIDRLLERPSLPPWLAEHMQVLRKEF